MKRGGGFPSGMQNLMKQANQLQAKMKEKQEELALREYEAQSGGGAVKVKVQGGKLVDLSIDSEVVNSDDIEMLQDLVLTAVNEGLKTSQDAQEEEMGKLTGGMNLPGMF